MGKYPGERERQGLSLFFHLRNEMPTQLRQNREEIARDREEPARSLAWLLAALRTDRVRGDRPHRRNLDGRAAEAEPSSYDRMRETLNKGLTAALFFASRAHVRAHTHTREPLLLTWDGIQEAKKWQNPRNKAG